MNKVYTDEDAAMALLSLSRGNAGAVTDASETATKTETTETTTSKDTSGTTAKVTASVPAQKPGILNPHYIEEVDVIDLPHIPGINARDFCAKVNLLHPGRAARAVAVCPASVAALRARTVGEKYLPEPAPEAKMY